MLRSGARLWLKRDFGNATVVMLNFVAAFCIFTCIYSTREQNSFYGVDLSPLYKDAIDEMFGKCSYRSYTL